MKITLNRTTDAIIGAVRVSQDIYDKLEAKAKKWKVSKQNIIRAILEEAIDKVEL